MTTTIASDCSTITLESTYENITNVSVLVTVIYNCGTETLVTWTAVDPIVLTPADIASTEATFADGIYSLTLVIVDENGDTITESDCVFVNCGTSCTMISTFTDAITGDDAAISRALAFQALVLAPNCTNCTCQDMCDFYSVVSGETCPTSSCSTCSTNGSTGCGCS